MNQEPKPVSTARRSSTYMFALTAALLMMFLLFTSAIVLIIVGRAGDKKKDREFNITLTSIYADVNATNAARIVTPTPAPPITQGEYLFAPDADPVFSALESCTAQIVSGQVLDNEGNPTDRYTVLVWGDFLPTTPITTGELSGEGEGRWTLVLNGMVNRRLWAQITAGNRYFSAPVEIVFDQAACDRNHVDIVFRQIAPLSEAR